MKTSSAFSLAILLSSASLLHAQVPALMSYQGRVVDSSGTGLGTGTPVNRKIIFRIFDAATGGNRIWSEEQTVTLSNGDFSVILGQGIAASYNGSPENPRPSLLDVFAGSDRYLEIVVDNGDNNLVSADTPITPRQRLISTAFAVRAATADSVRAGTDLTLRDPNHGLGWYGTGRPFNGVNLDGPVLYGYNGGMLGSVNGAVQKTALRWTNDGKIGVGGVVSPTEALDVLGNIKASGTITGGKLVSNDTVAARGDAGFTFHTVGDNDSGLFSPSDGTLTFRNDGVERIRINAAGNLGVGLTNPGEKIDVSGNIRASGLIQGSSVGSSGNLYVTSQTYTSGLLMKGGFPVTDTNFGGDGNFISFSHNGVSEDYLGYRSNTFYFKDSPGGGDSTEPGIHVGGPGSFGGLVNIRGLYNGGMGIETTSGLINFGLNDSPSNRFGGSYERTAQGGVFRVDARDGYDVFQFLARAKDSSSDVGVVASITAAGKMALGGKRVTVGEEDLRIVRGVLTGLGSAATNVEYQAPLSQSLVLRGSGYKLLRISTGRYRIVFNTAFSEMPAFTFNPIQGVGAERTFAKITLMSPTTVEIELPNDDDSGRSDSAGFSFIAAGPR
ncbi:hypothetical protein [Luteolibacter luteus]|uniref:Uncharacterized protein n=1 Tax=Luteolibacter luteus TaxID=2728835 RepID=A0A858RJ38_9BACT|nr:hypothetical protein [Luteolibacter luteus]QJE96927.1 hypothetical protein HHL09_14405 [Luteolibacter luteus]